MIVECLRCFYSWTDWGDKVNLIRRPAGNMSQFCKMWATPYRYSLPLLSQNISFKYYFAIVYTSAKPEKNPPPHTKAWIISNGTKKILRGQTHPREMHPAQTDKRTKENTSQKIRGPYKRYSQCTRLVPRSCDEHIWEAQKVNQQYIEFYFYLPGQRSARWTRQQLFLGRAHRCANPWNAFLRQKLSEANAGAS